MSKARKSLIVSLAVLFAVNIIIITLAQTAQAATYQSGSTGEAVRVIQDTLSRWGYYSGGGGGIYDGQTAAAVKQFQRASGLPADGVAGPETLTALGVSENAPGNAHDSALMLLARVISAEAGDEPYAGQVAVGAVIVNRVSDPAFPGTIAGVVYQPGAFACLTDGRFDKPVSETAVRAAQAALNGTDPSGGAVCYFNPKTAVDAQLWSRPLIKVIGQYRFCGRWI